MYRYPFLVALLAVSGSGADAATLIVQTSSYMGGISSDGPVGGTDYQGIATNTAGGDASAQFFSESLIQNYSGDFSPLRDVV